LREVCGEQKVDRSAVSRWATRFREGRATINDGQRPGRPKTSTDERSMKRVADFLAQDRRATCYRDFTNIIIPYFDKRCAEKKHFCPIGPSVLDC